MTLEEAKERLKDFTYAKCEEYCYDRGEDCFDCYIELEQVVAIETIMKELNRRDEIINTVRGDIATLESNIFEVHTDVNVLKNYLDEAIKTCRGEING